MKKAGNYGEKVNVTLPQGIYAKLSQLAKQQTRSEASLAAFMVEYFVLFIAPGIYPGLKEETPTDQMLQLIVEKSILGQQPLTDCELSILAENLNLDQKKLTLVRDDATATKDKEREEEEYAA